MGGWFGLRAWQSWFQEKLIIATFKQSNLEAWKLLLLLSSKDIWEIKRDLGEQEISERDLRDQ